MAKLKEEGYLAEQIFHVDETELYWKRMPERTYIQKESKRMHGFKLENSFLPSNATIGTG